VDSITEIFTWEGREGEETEEKGSEKERGCQGRGVPPLLIVALWNRADHYIFMLWFVVLLLSFLA